MLQIQSSTETDPSGPTSGPSGGWAPLEWRLDSVAGRIWACAERQRNIAAIVSDTWRHPLTDEPPVVAVVERPVAPIADFALHLGPGIPRPEQATAEEWLPVDSDPPATEDSLEGGVAVTSVGTVSAPDGHPTSLFDDLFTAVSTSRRGRNDLVGPLPPARRFMVRVAPAKRPHRSTKRNYDYFEELNESLKQLATSKTDPR